MEYVLVAILGIVIGVYGLYIYQEYRESKQPKEPILVKFGEGEFGVRKRHPRFMSYQYAVLGYPYRWDFTISSITIGTEQEARMHLEKLSHTSAEGIPVNP